MNICFNITYIFIFCQLINFFYLSHLEYIVIITVIILIIRDKIMNDSYSTPTNLNQQIENLYQQIISIPFNDINEIIKYESLINRMLMQDNENIELLILQMHLEILNSREQRARSIAARIWELGGNLSNLFEKMYLDDLLNLGLLEMAMLLIKPHFENLQNDIDIYPLEMIKFAIMTGSIPLLKKIINAAPQNPLYDALNQFADAYQLNHYEEHFKNIQKIVIETFGKEICAYDYNIYTDRGFTDLEIVLYFSNSNTELTKYLTLLENRINGYFLSTQTKRIYNLSFDCQNIKDHPE